MSKVKNYYWDLAEKEVDKITDEYLAGKSTKILLKIKYQELIMSTC